MSDQDFRHPMAGNAENVNFDDKTMKKSHFLILIEFSRSS